ncbi:hypothetical protein X975_26534, partial [Stegodyphus mimosarum]
MNKRYTQIIPVPETACFNVKRRNVSQVLILNYLKRINFQRNPSNYMSQIFIVIFKN